MPPKKRTTTKKKAEESVIEPPKSGSGRSYLILVLIIAMGLSAAYLLIKGSNVNDAPAKQAAEKGAMVEGTQEKELSLIEKVARHIVINEQEEPFIATINNLEAVRKKNPMFYKDAENGDRLLIWSDKAVLYSEDKDLIVAVAMALPDDEQELLMEDQEGSATNGEEAELMEGSTMALEETSVEIRNGSRIAGEAGRLRTTLVGGGLSVSRIGDAAAVYDGSFIVDQTDGQASPAINVISEVIEATVTSTLPTREPASNADILILIGR